MKSSMQAAAERTIRSTAVLNIAILVLAVGASYAETAVAGNGVVAIEPKNSQSASGTGVLRPRWVSPRRALKREQPSEDSALGAQGSSSKVPDETDSETVAEIAIADLPTSSPDAADDVSFDWRNQAHIVIHGSKETDRLASLVAGLLRDLGADDIERRIVDVAVDLDHIRYFHVEDQAMATALAAELEDVFGSVSLRGLPRYQPSPTPGLLELWLR